MGYTTQFDGVLRFDKPLTPDEYDYINTILGQDAREHPEWNSRVNYIDLELLSDGHDITGLQWDGAEKSYFMIDQINLVTRLMRKINPQFKLIGKMLAQGEEAGDIWCIVIDENGIAYRKSVKL